METSKQKFIVFFTLAIILILLFAILLFKKQSSTFFVEGRGSTLKRPQSNIIENPSPFSGTGCEKFKSRAFGVIVAQYPETMPLSGLSQADIVVEWPVANAGGITRLLLIFQCQEPQEIGSIRSARPYIADIAKGFDIIFVSWGGPNVLYQEIKKINLDWLNAMEAPMGVFFRKSGKPAPHNGFTSMERLKNGAVNKKFRAENNFDGYKFLKKEEVAYKQEDQVINIAYKPAVKFIYDKNTGNYFRYWNNNEVIDKNTNSKVYAKNVVLLKTNIGVLREGVAYADIIGEGETKIYRGGEEIIGKWKKQSADSKLFFLDTNGEEIKFIPGPIWIEIVHTF